MRIKTRQKIDRLIGPFICFFLTVWKNFTSLFFNSYHIKKISHQDEFTVLIIKFWGMGSILLASDGVSSIKKNFPKSKIIFLTLSRNIELLSYLEIVDKFFVINVDAGIIKFISDVINTILQLRKEKIDLVIDLEFFTRFSAIVSYFVRPKIISGFHDWVVYRGNLHNVKVPFNRYWHVKKNFENLIIKSFPGNEFKIFNYELKINLSLADRIFSKFGISSDNFVIVNVNAGDLSLERRWPRKNFVKLIKWLIEKYKIQVVLIGTEAEKKYVEMVEKEVDSAYVKNLSGKINLEELIVLLKKTKFFITNDSGPLHLAVKLGCKTISFFGPETPILYGPLNKEHIVFFKNIDCSPCINVHTGKMVKCPHINPPCLSKIEVEEVKQKIEFSGWI